MQQSGDLLVNQWQFLLLLWFYQSAFDLHLTYLFVCLYFGQV